jgi:hypothetical protein
MNAHSGNYRSECLLAGRDHDSAMMNRIEISGLRVNANVARDMSSISSAIIAGLVVETCDIHSSTHEY